MYSTFRTLLNASLTALVKQDPTRPMDWKTPSLRQAQRNFREGYSLPRSIELLSFRS